MDVKKLQMTA